MTGGTAAAPAGEMAPASGVMFRAWADWSRKNRPWAFLDPHQTFRAYMSQRDRAVAQKTLMALASAVEAQAQRSDVELVEHAVERAGGAAMIREYAGRYAEG